VGGHDQPAPLRRIGDLRLDDRGKDEVAERPATVPPFVGALRDFDLRLRVRVEVGQRREPVDAR
jgi:hypothetical protein